METQHFTNTQRTDAILGHLNIVKYLVGERYAHLDVKGEYGDTSIIWAATQVHLEIVKYFSEISADVNQANNNGNSVIHDFAMNGYLNILRYPIDVVHADLNAKGEYGNTAQIWAANKEIKVNWML